MTDINIQVEVEINPTEDIGKVRMAVENIFGRARSLRFEEKPLCKGTILATGFKDIEGLSKFANLLRRERIRAAARKVLFQSLKENTITFYLNKQVAYSSHISFSEPVAESPLGPIKVRITCDNPRKLIDWLAPRTT